jgi:tetratricopeptide (TPR) repeat protein
MFRTRLWLAVLPAFILGLHDEVRAADPRSMFAVVRDAEVSLNDNAVGTLGRGEIVSVFPARNQQIFVQGRVSGWIDSDCTLPLKRGLSDFEEAIRKDKPDTASYLGRAGVRNAMGQFDAAIADCGEAIRLKPDYAVAYQVRAAAWLGKKEPAKAIADLDEAMRIDPRDPSVLLARGKIHVAVLCFGKAIDDFSAALRLKAESGEALIARAEAYFNKKAYAKAIDDIDHLLAGNPTNFALLNLRAACFERQGDYSIADGDYSAAIQISGDEILRMRSQLLSCLSRGEFAAAAEEFRYATYMNEERAKIFARRGNSRRMAKNFETALADFEEVIAMFPKSPLGYCGRASCRMSQQQSTAAMADFDTALKLDPNCSDTYHQRALAWNDLGEYDKAIADLKRWIQLRQNDAISQNDYAWFLATCPDPQYRDGKQAIELAKKACELTLWQNEAYLDTLASAYAEIGDFAQAVSWQKKAVEAATPEANMDYTDRLALYEAHRPFHNTPTAAKSPDAGPKAK